MPPSTAMVTTMGVAEASPPKPTRGVAREATKNCAAPITAAPAPRVAGVASASPSALAFDMVNPAPAVRINAVAIKPGIDSVSVISITTNDTAAHTNKKDPAANIFDTPSRTDSCELSRVAKMIAEAAAVKLKAYGTWPMPRMVCITNGEAEIQDIMHAKPELIVMVTNENVGVTIKINLELIRNIEHHRVKNETKTNDGQGKHRFRQNTQQRTISTPKWPTSALIRWQ